MRDEFYKRSNAHIYLGAEPVKANYMRLTPIFLYSQILNQAKMIKVVHLIIYLTAYILF